MNKDDHIERGRIQASQTQDARLEARQIATDKLKHRAAELRRAGLLTAARTLEREIANR